VRRPGVDAALPETTMGSGWLCRQAGSRAVAATAPGTKTLAGHAGVAAGENWRGSGRTRVHAMPAAWACDPGMTHDRNGG
jgi:hypothetical protein